ncbi:hypothetical protein SAMN05421543_12023 [Alicyclobacillus macrosporangiidus]|uniref:Uncharacterized protein n=1 Tax=Alicyclobacillus macrosporangiidus TaxID=392015 RepID=A0A1I7KVZ4_9BACL|nr:hypothetical protein SAMN05421543_12023 [Alicyclobacillus macrosporangiidus]
MHPERSQDSVGHADEGGPGFVGSPMAMPFAKTGPRVTGLDADLAMISIHALSVAADADIRMADVSAQFNGGSALRWCP